MEKLIYDLILSFCSLALLIPLISIIIKNIRNKKCIINKFDSLFTSIPLFLMACCFFQLRLFFNSIVTLISSLLWLIIFIQSLYYLRYENIIHQSV